MLKSILTTLIPVLTLLFSVQMHAGNPSTVLFDLNNCSSFSGTTSPSDYSEFTPTITNGVDGPVLSVLLDRVYRNNPMQNRHSCTPGVNGSKAFCVSYDSSCDYNAGSDLAVRFDILVAPPINKSATLTTLDFYELSPEMFDWIAGASGLNNYSTSYAVRVTVSGQEVYREEDIPTNRSWTLQSFDFTGIDAFTVDRLTVFNFELLAYCPVGNFALQSVWDLDEIQITAECLDVEDCNVNGQAVSVDGGSVALGNGDIEIDACVGDILLEVRNTSSAASNDYYYVITDDADNILAFANSASTSLLDLSGAPAGECHIWGWHQVGQSDPILGENIQTLNDDSCEEVSSNFITVNRRDPEGGTLEGGPFEFCVGDGEADNLTAGDITLSGNSGTNSQWVVTDDQGNILGLPPMPSAVDFDGAGAGTCLIWHLSFEDGLQGAVMGANANDLVGCFSLSNPISVVRSQPEGGTLEGGPFEFCVGDGEADNLAAGDITLSGNSGTNSQWVVTDDQGNILGLPPMPSVVDFDGAGAGTCLIWHLSFEDGLQGAVMGANANDLVGCFSLSNPISVVRYQPEGGTLEGGPFEFCVGDGEADNLATGDITLIGNSGTNSQWVVTDDQGNILGLPPMPSVVDFDGAGLGTCLIWHLSFEDGLQGAVMGANANDLEGCFSLSNPISVVRSQPDGGMLEGGPFEFIVDGIPDMVSGITLSGNSGPENAWVITDDQGNILGLPPMPGVVDFDAAGAGVCLIWNISYVAGLTGLEAGNNVSQLEGCYALSNSVTVERIGASPISGGTLEGGPFEFCVDGTPDMVSGITLSDNTGPENAWVITDELGNILGLPPVPGVVDFDGAGAGVCLIWHISYDTGLSGLQMGNNVSQLTGNFDLSNSIEVVRNQPQGGTLEGGPFEFCVGDGEADNLSTDDITLSGNSGTNSQWVVTDDQGNILGLPPMPSAVDFDGAGSGTCLIWHLSFEDGLQGAEMGANANDLQGCFSLSNPISVVRSQPEGGTLEGGPFEFCVGDGEADNLSTGDITLSGNSGTNSQWVVTDDQGNILGLPPMPSAVDFNGAGSGTCLIWHLSFEDGLQGAEMGANANDLQGCFSLSNPISVVRTQPNGGTLAGGPFEFTVGDTLADMIPAGAITLSGNQGANSQWLVTDDEGYILGLPPMPGVVDFNGAGPGTCLVWHLSYDGDIEGLAAGMNANDLIGCYSLSNAIEVIRTAEGNCQANGGVLFGGPFEFTVGDGIDDNIPMGSITLANSQGTNSQWIVTDDEGYILGLPPMPSAVNFDRAGPGVCIVWHLSYDGTIEGLEAGMNANDLIGCHSLSNGIEVQRLAEGDCQANGGVLFGGPFEFIVGDGVDDFIPVDAITLANSQGMNSQWIVTDDQGNILGLPPIYSDVNFEGAGAGTCQVWHISYDTGLQGLEINENVADLVGCFSINNAVNVERTENSIDIIESEDSENKFSFKVFPNPSTDYFSIDIKSDTDEFVELSLVNTEGKVMRQLKVSKNEQIDISDLNSGLYYIKVSSKYRIDTKKFFKI